MIIKHALYDISQTIPKQQPKYAELNWVVSLIMTGITTPTAWRSSGKSNGANLALPFLRLHFFAPHCVPTDATPVKVTVQHITDQMWS